ncbi:class I SAM-dependent methyltransferase [Nocardioides aurantiacus]|uniref:Methyltransferase family protein n=1 Tax=Nocardioides aurantiacus TaxID=86796 RepID=A0A3N2CWL5_9ACTN|nr:class I SAM-dependent methyltransferase [Nocardioides aurantiacus]ROR91866.1 methyltransferase family protein [Nocardioides aurantiacus]
MAETSGSARHWDTVYATKDTRTVSWHEDVPTTSLRLIGPRGSRTSVVDIGAGASPLGDHLVAQRWEHVTLLDVSDEGLALTRERLRQHAPHPELVVSDVLDWSPARQYDVWHDRAVLHFLTDPGDRARYVDLAARTVAPQGHLVVGGFAPDGPTHCSGLPTAQRSAHELALEFAEHFTQVELDTDTHTTPSGAEQAFAWAVLQRR